jgi:uncharacterized BrkB/YihY/UPF0761 family membrane protein
VHNLPFDTVLKPILTTAAVTATPLLLVGSFLWLFRSGRTVRPARRKLFLASILATSAAYAGHFVLRWFLRHAHLNLYDQADLTVGIGGLMFLAAFVALITSAFGRSYGRITGACASALVCALWWLTTITPS